MTAPKSNVSAPYKACKVRNMADVRKRALSSTLTSKGQMTLPKEVREALSLCPGDRLDVTMEDGRIVMTPRTLHIDDICSILPRPAKPATIEEMQDAIERGAAE